jgi:hypothetical protein
MFFQRQGLHDRAINWYLKDIDSSELPTVLTQLKLDLKIIERLISAYSLTTNKKMQSNLKDLIDRCLVKAAHHAAIENRLLQEYLRSHPSPDVRSSHLSLGLSQWYKGEVTREAYFLSLLYNKFILGVDYSEIDYARFFEY